MTGGFEAYKFYIALKAHFSSKDYDVFTNNGRTKTSRNAFEGRRDRGLFDKLARKFPNPRELIQFLVANFAYGNDYSLVDNQVSDDNYIEWVKRRQSITQTFKNDCQKILLTLQKNNEVPEKVFLVVDNDLPLVLKLLLGNHITIETISILDDYNKMINNWQSSSLGFMMEASTLKVCKLKKFIKYDATKIEPIYNKLLIDLQHDVQKRLS